MCYQCKECIANKYDIFTGDDAKTHYVLYLCIEQAACCSVVKLYTAKPLKGGHFGGKAQVCCTEIVPISALLTLDYQP